MNSSVFRDPVRRALIAILSLLSLIEMALVPRVGPPIALAASSLDGPHQSLLSENTAQSVMFEPGSTAAGFETDSQTSSTSLDNGICIYYYGGFNNTVKQMFVTDPPEFLVLNTPGGSYKTISRPTPADISELKASGIKVLSYVSTGNMVNFKYAADSPPNDRTFVRNCIETVAEEGCDGIFFDEGGVGNWRDVLGRFKGTIADRYYRAPDIDMYGNPGNSWAGYTVEDYIGYAHSLGLIAVEGTDFRDPHYLHTNMFEIADYVLTDEHYTGRASDGSEVGYESKCWVIGYGLSSADAAASYTNAALGKGFGASYHCVGYGTVASWYESYYSLMNSELRLPQQSETPNTSVTYRLSVAVAGQGTTNPPPGLYGIPPGQEVSIQALPASGWKFVDWSYYPTWTENPTTWTMVEPISIVAVFEQLPEGNAPPSSVDSGSDITSSKNVTSENSGPVLDPMHDITMNSRRTLKFALYATDVDGDSLTYSASGLPEGSTFDTASGAFSWKPERDQTGSYTITFECSDGSLTDTATLTILVR